MNPIPAAGLLIGLLCAIWMFMMGFTGWYKDPARLNLFIVPVFVVIGGLIWGLRKTAAEGRTSTGQVVAGATISGIAGLVIFCSSLIFTTAGFPDYFDEVNAISRETLRRQGQTETEIQQALDAAAPLQTPFRNALIGLAGTLVRGVMASAVIAVWVRARSSDP